MDPRALVPVGLILATRLARREMHAWAVTVATLGLVFVALPAYFAFAAALGAAAFLARAASRLADGGAATPAVGALFCVHLALWTAHWSGGALPTHILALDLALALAVALFAWRARVRAPLLGLAALAAQAAVQTRLVTAPITGLEWGVWSTILGFVLLVATVAATVRLHLRSPPS